MARRGRTVLRRSAVDPQMKYINVRIEQLKSDMAKAHDEHDKNWYNRLIQELTWARDIDSGQKGNCYMGEEYGLTEIA